MRCVEGYFLLSVLVRELHGRESHPSPPLLTPSFSSSVRPPTSPFRLSSSSFFFLSCSSSFSFSSSSFVSLLLFVPFPLLLFVFHLFLLSLLILRLCSSTLSVQLYLKQVSSGHPRRCGQSCFLVFFRCLPECGYRFILFNTTAQHPKPHNTTPTPRCNISNTTTPHLSTPHPITEH